MKTRILSPSTNWKPVLDEVVEKAPFLAGGKDFEVSEFSVKYMLTEEYRDGKYGLNKTYLRMIISPYPEEIIMLHIPDFPVQGAVGWIHYQMIDGTVMQLYRDHLREYSRSGEFKYRTAETIVHELCHRYYFKFGLQDKTHYFHYEKGRLLSAVEDIKKHLLKEKVSLLEQVVRLLRRNLTPKPDSADIKHYYCLHHSGTSRDYTRPETIIHNSTKKHGKCFYDIIIDKDGNITYVDDPLEKERGTTDIVVLGNFVVEEPSEGQIKALKSILKGHQWTTHRELGRQGLAHPSVCPANLTNYLS